MSTLLTLRLIGLAAFCSMASMRVCDPMLIELGREFNVSTGNASQVISAFAIAYGLMQLIYGPLGDRIGKLRVITAATFGCAAFSALTAMARHLICWCYHAWPWGRQRPALCPCRSPG